MAGGGATGPTGPTGPTGAAGGGNLSGTLTASNLLYATGANAVTGIANSIGNTPTNGFTLSNGTTVMTFDPSVPSATFGDGSTLFCEAAFNLFTCAAGTPESPANPTMTLSNTQLEFLDASGGLASSIVGPLLTLGDLHVTTGAIHFNGAGGLQASLGISTSAGSAVVPQVNLPNAAGTTGQVLVTDGANPQQTSWVGSAAAGNFLVLTTATADTATVTGVTSSSFCVVSAADSISAANVVGTYVSNITTNSVEITHPATVDDGAVVEIVCSLH